MTIAPDVIYAMPRGAIAGQYYLNYSYWYNSSCYRFASIQPTLITNALALTTAAWALKFLGTISFTTLVFTADYLQPLVNVTVVAIDEMSGPEDTSPIKYWIPGSDFAVLKSPDIYHTPGDPTKPRLTFVDLVSPYSGTKALGAVVLDGRHPRDIVQRLTIYQVDARWCAKRTNFNNIPDLGTVAYRNWDDVSGKNSTIGDGYGLCSQPISMSKEWAMYSNPFVPESNASAFPTVHASYSLADFSTVKMRFLTSTGVMVAALVANGLSNIALKYHQEGDIIHTGIVLAKNWTNLYNTGSIMDEDVTMNRAFNISFSSRVTGYSYNHDGVWINVAISILLTYASIAIVFVLYTSIRGISSSAWDSIAELTTLAINSPPSSQLANTCAGITTVNTYKTMAKVVVVDSTTSDTHQHGQTQQSGGGGSSGVKHAQLVFRDGRKKRPDDCEGKGKGEPDKEQLIQPNERYGACPC